MHFPSSLSGLDQYNQFIVYKLVPKGNGKSDKFPLNIKTGVVSNAHDPSIWVTAQEAINYVTTTGAPDIGLGFVFTENDPWFFIDIDDCIDHNGSYSKLALEILNMVPGAAVEISSSGKGLHIFGYGTPPPHACKNTGLGIEFYHKDRFVAFGHLETMVGNIYQDYSEYLPALVDRYFSPKDVFDTDEWTTEPDPNWVGPEDDDVLIEKALSASNKSAANAFGNKASFADLWNGNVDALAESYPANDDKKSYDGSSADAALAQHLMFWTGKNCERTERLMRMSALVRDKWDKHKSYLKLTITNAKTQQRHVYKTRDVTLQPKPEPTPDGMGSMTGQGWNYFHIGFVDAKANGKPKATYPNFLQMLKAFNITCRYNMMNKDVDIIIPGSKFIPESSKNNAYAVLVSLAAAVEFPVQNIMDYVGLHGVENAYHPAIDWIDSKPWDSVDRFGALVDTLDAMNRPLAEMLLRKWAISAINHLYAPTGAKSSGVLVLQGGQNAGKTRWLMNLCKGGDGLAKEGVLLNPTDRDSLKQATSNWIVELGELDATFRKADIAALKAFITRDHDEFRAPYARVENKYPRRTAFCATVNPREYLHDDENRRYWNIEVGKGLIHDHSVDMQQFWAQMKNWWENKVDVTWLTKQEHLMVEDYNENFKSVAYEVELLQKNYNMAKPCSREMTTSEILIEIGIDPKEARKWSTHLQKFTGQKPRRTAKGNVYEMPYINNPFLAGG